MKVNKKLENFLSGRWDFRYNIITSKIEYAKKGENNFKPVTDRIFFSILRQITSETDIKCSEKKLREILGSNFVPAFHPFHTYFESIPNWDGEDHLGKLAGLVKTQNDQFWPVAFKKWFIAMVATMREVEIVNHQFIMLLGPQGIGKTTFCYILVPKELKHYIYIGNPNFKSKDSQFTLAECFLIIFDEVDYLTLSKIETLKEAITKPHINDRRPYGRTKEYMPKVASFIGSGNNMQPLSDLTGSRRFLCFETLKIDQDGLKKVSIEQCYAQALHLLETGFKYYFSEKDIVEIEENNKYFQSVNVEEELLLNHFNPIQTAEFPNEKLLMTSEILQYICARENLHFNPNKSNMLGKILKKNEFQRVPFKSRYRIRVYVSDKYY